MSQRLVSMDDANLITLSKRFPGLSPNKAITLLLQENPDTYLITNKDLEKYVIKEKEEKYT